MKPGKLYGGVRPLGRLMGLCADMFMSASTTGPVYGHLRLRAAHLAWDNRAGACQAHIGRSFAVWGICLLL
jgi:hypothetical protein